MKAITILQPWAGLIACGAKQIETRSWKTSYRGPIAIHAAKDEDKKQERIRHIVFKAEQRKIILPDLHFGKVVAIADLVDCSRVIGKERYRSGSLQLIRAALENGRIVTGAEEEFGDYTPGRYVWILANVRQIDPVPVRGKQRIWEWEGQEQAISL